jgi:hypothetical protein
MPGEEFPCSTLEDLFCQTPEKSSRDALPPNMFFEEKSQRACQVFDLAKIDAQGAELLIIQKGKNILKRAKFLMMELPLGVEYYKKTN